MNKFRFIHFYLLFIFTIIFCFFIYMYNGQMKYNEMIINLKSRKIDGEIVNLIEGNKGFSEIEISEQNSKSKIKIKLPISWDIDHFNIEVGDSLRKNPFDNSICFYKSTKGKSIEIYKYQIE
ncbi:MAG: hypothetical protein RLZZ323_1631 [Bacteroidota bacterium]